MQILKEKLVTTLAIFLHLSMFLIYISSVLILISLFYDIFQSLQGNRENQLYIFDELLGVSILLILPMFGAIFLLIYPGPKGVHNKINDIIYYHTDIDVDETISNAPIILMSCPIIILTFAYLFWTSNNAAQEYIDDLMFTLFEKRVHVVIEPDVIDNPKGQQKYGTGRYEGLPLIKEGEIIISTPRPTMLTFQEVPLDSSPLKWYNVSVGFDLDSFLAIKTGLVAKKANNTEAYGDLDYLVYGAIYRGNFIIMGNHYPHEVQIYSVTPVDGNWVNRGLNLVCKEESTPCRLSIKWKLYQKSADD